MTEPSSMFNGFNKTPLFTLGPTQQTHIRICLCRVDGLVDVFFFLNFALSFILMKYIVYMQDEVCQLLSSFLKDVAIVIKRCQLVDELARCMHLRFPNCQ